MALQSGTRLGPYEIVSALGAGGMGEVYRARDTRLQRDVAVKVLAPSLAADPGFRTRFSREARIISQLDHPNICALFDVGEHDGTSFIVMPLLDGRSLADRAGPASVAETLRIGVGLASALAHAHKQGVLHRDVKPRNVMIHADGSVKLVDFGIAKAMADGVSTAETTAALTHDGWMIGTLEYMSPEQVGGKPLDARSDIFSLAVVLYELATGRHPFRGDSRLATAASILACKYQPIASADPHARALDGVLSKAIVREPSDRYSTMEEFLAALQRVQGMASGTRRKSPAIMAGAAVAALVVLLLGAWLASRLSNPPVAAAAGPEATPDVFVGTRPGLGSPSANRSSYRTVSGGVNGPSDRIGEIGVTLWRLRKSKPEDEVRLLVHEAEKSDAQLTPERIELDTPLHEDDLVRMSVESPRAGYLYVIDRERFADGTTGAPFLIFPTKSTNNGDNRLTAGRLVDIPAQTDRKPFFTLKRKRADSLGELITLIVSPEPLMDVAPDDQMSLRPEVVTAWEHNVATSPVERLEMVGGAGRAWSRQEQEAAADGTRRLTQDDPGPQTVFRVVTSTPGLLVVQLTLAQR
jgi:hypothetical protein